MVQNSFRPYQSEIEALRKAQAKNPRKRITKAKSDPSAPRNYPERDLVHLPLVVWFKKQYPQYGKYLAHYAAERKCTPWQGALLKSLGVIAGFSDLMLLVPTKRFPGLFLELKAPGNKPTAIQKQFLADMAAIGYCSAWVDSFDAGKELIIDYLDGV